MQRMKERETVIEEEKEKAEKDAVNARLEAKIVKEKLQQFEELNKTAKEQSEMRKNEEPTMEMVWKINNLYLHICYLFAIFRIYFLRHEKSHTF